MILRDLIAAGAPKPPFGLSAPIDHTARTLPKIVWRCGVCAGTAANFAHRVTCASCGAIKGEGALAAE